MATEETEPTPKLPAAPKKKMNWVKRSLIILLIILVGMQFFQPFKNNQSMDMAYDITTVVTVPADVQTLLKKACYDCHSNFTEYPWYSNIQPVGLWLANHVDEGKSHLNFQEFASIKPSKRFNTIALRQDHVLEEIIDVVKKEEMPLTSYTIIHREAKLTEAQRKLIVDWASDARAQLSK